MQRLIAGNWKIHGMAPHLREVEAVAAAVKATAPAAHILICLPGTLIARAVQTAAGRIGIGGEDCSAEIDGAFTVNSTPGLGSGQSFAVLDASTITNTGPTTSVGDLDVFPAPAFVHQTDAVAQQAQAGALSAYNFLAAQSVSANLTGQGLGTARTLRPGVRRREWSGQNNCVRHSNIRKHDAG
jgi:hypothetical protein